MWICTQDKQFSSHLQLVLLRLLIRYGGDLWAGVGMDDTMFPEGLRIRFVQDLFDSEMTTHALLFGSD